MYPKKGALECLQIITLVAFITHAAVIHLPNDVRLPSLLIHNLTHIPSPATAHSPNLTFTPLTFLGIECYHLSPHEEKVTELTCQKLFAELYRRGHVYETFQVYNGWGVRSHGEPCNLKVAHAGRGGRIRISMAELVSHAVAVLQTCQETATGGAYTFEGNWKVQVSGHPIERPVGGGGEGEE